MMGTAVEKSTLSLLDYVVLTITLLISASIGIYFRFTGGRQKTTQEYLLGDRKQSVLPVAFSLMASFMSAITLLGVSSEIYLHGTLFLVINFSYIIFTPISLYLYLPVFFKLQTTSAYEYLEIRFGSTARLSASVLYSLQMILYMGIVLYGPAIALEALTGLSQNISVLVVGLVCTFYSTIGGMKAVIFTDVFQSLLMFAAIFSVITAAVLQKGGFLPIFEIAKERGRIEFFSIDPDPTVRHTYWSLLIGGGFTYLSLYAINQTQVQRCLTMKDLKTAAKSIWISMPILILLSFSTGLAGLSIFSKYYNCDPVLKGRISNRDQLMPLFVVESMGHLPGLSGLFISGIFSASLSTVSACVNSLAAVTLLDYIKPLYVYTSKKPFPDCYSAPLLKMLALGFGVLCVAIAYLAQYISGLLQASLSIFGVVGGPLLGIFSLGMFCPCARELGAVVGIISGLAVSLMIAFGGPKPPLKPLPLSTEGCASNMTYYVPSSTTLKVITNTTLNNGATQYFYLYRLSYLWYIVIGFLVTFVIGLLVSGCMKAFGRDIVQLDPDLFSPPVAHMLRKRRRRSNLFLENKKACGVTPVIANGEDFTHF